MSNCWGYSYWNCNWHGGTVVYKSTVYYGNSAWHGGYYGSSPCPTAQRCKPGAAYNPSTGTLRAGRIRLDPLRLRQRPGQAYNPNTGAYAATHQASNAYGSYGSSVVSRTARLRTPSIKPPRKGPRHRYRLRRVAKAAAASGANGNSAAAGQTANGNKYAAANGNVYKNTGSGWQQTQGETGSNSAAARGYGCAGKEQRVIGL